MKRQNSISAIALTVVLLSSVRVYGACPAKLYVAVDGQSGWSGSLAAANQNRSDGPLPSLEAARDKIRALCAAGCQSGVLVEVRGGIYRLDRPFELGAQDSGTQARPVVYEAYAGEQPVLSGGRVVTGWRKNGQGEWCAANSDRTTQLFVNGTRAQRVAGCTFDALGGYAIHLLEGSRENRIEHNNFYDLGAGAVRVGERTVPQNDSQRVLGNAIDDNEIHAIGLVYPSAVAVWIQQSSSNSVAHNHMYDLPYTAVSVGWTWGYGPSAADHNRVEFNSIHDVGTVLSDLGGVYVLGKQPGTVIRNNLIHDVHCFTYGGWGIYLDEGTSDVVVENNIVYRTESSGFHQHYGRDHMVRTNIFAFGSNFQLMLTRPEPTISFRFEHNIVLYDNGALLGSNWGAGRYQMDHNLYRDMRGGMPRFGADTWDEWRKKGNDAHSRIADPEFANPLSYDFRLSAYSPALRIGIHAIDLRTVGPRPWNVPSRADRAPAGGSAATAAGVSHR